MDPVQSHSFPPHVSASPGVDPILEETATSATSATLAVTYPAMSYQIPSGMVAVPLNERDPQKTYTRWNGQAVEVSTDPSPGSEKILAADHGGPDVRSTTTSTQSTSAPQTSTACPVNTTNSREVAPC
jgi:hypothetical protein